MTPRLTNPQRAFLKVAARSKDGNPWPQYPMVGGGATMRMADRLVTLGFMETHNKISAKGRAAVARRG